MKIVACAECSAGGILNQGLFGKKIVFIEFDPIKIPSSVCPHIYCLFRFFWQGRYKVSFYVMIVRRFDSKAVLWTLDRNTKIHRAWTLSRCSRLSFKPSVLSAVFSAFSWRSAFPTVSFYELLITYACNRQNSENLKFWAELMRTLAFQFFG